MTHTAHLESDLLHGWRVCCSCTWVSAWMGEGDAFATKTRGLADRGHAQYRPAAASQEKEA